MSNQDFKQLQKKWYQKLSDSGFDDIERSDLNSTTITPQIFSSDSKSAAKRARAKYILLNYPTFLPEKDITVLHLYSTGLTVTEIASRLEVTHQNVSRRLRRLFKRFL